MSTRALGDTTISQCSACSGIFLRRGDLGSMIEAENDWHRHSSAHTAPIPRITADMASPPVPRPMTRAWIETLFSG